MRVEGLNDPGVGLEALVSALSVARGLEDLLLVRADRAVPYGVLAQLLAGARAAGFTRYQLVVLGEGPPGGR
jgi:biopolymer transport protein ExbD